MIFISFFKTVFIRRCPSKLFLQTVLVFALCCSILAHSPEQFSDGTVCRVHYISAWFDCFRAGCFFSCVHHCKLSHYTGHACYKSKTKLEMPPGEGTFTTNDSNQMYTPDYDRDSNDIYSSGPTVYGTSSQHPLMTSNEMESDDSPKSFQSHQPSSTVTAQSSNPKITASTTPFLQMAVTSTSILSISPLDSELAISNEHFPLITKPFEYGESTTPTYSESLVSFQVTRSPAGAYSKSSRSNEPSFNNNGIIMSSTISSPYTINKPELSIEPSDEKQPENDESDKNQESGWPTEYFEASQLLDLNSFPPLSTYLFATVTTESPNHGGGSTEPPTVSSHSVTPMKVMGSRGAGPTQFISQGIIPSHLPALSSNFNSNDFKNDAESVEPTSKEFDVTETMPSPSATAIRISHNANPPTYSTWASESPSSIHLLLSHSSKPGKSPKTLPSDSHNLHSSAVNSAQGFTSSSEVAPPYNGDESGRNGSVSDDQQSPTITTEILSWKCERPTFQSDASNDLLSPSVMATYDVAASYIASTQSIHGVPTQTSGHADDTRFEHSNVNPSSTSDGISETHLVTFGTPSVLSTAILSSFSPRTSQKGSSSNSGTNSNQATSQPSVSSIASGTPSSTISKFVSTAASPFPSIPPLWNEARKSESKLLKIDGQFFQLEYQSKVAAGGIISLVNPVLYPSVTCLTGGISVTHSEILRKKPLQELYPVGSIVYVPFDRTEGCRLSASKHSENGVEQILDKRLLEFHHSYLRVSSVYPTRDGAMVFGVEATYFSLLQEANISLTPWGDDTGVTEDPLLRPSSLNTSYLHGNLTAERLLSETEGIMSQGSKLLSFAVFWNDDAVKMEIKLISDWKAAVKLDALLKRGTNNGTYATNLFSSITDVIPPIVFFHDIPPFRIGIAWDVPLVGDSKSILGVDVPAYASIDYTSPKSEISLLVEGSYDKMTSRYSARRMVIPGARVGEAVFDATVNEFDDPYGLTVSFKLSMIPTFSIYLPTLTARVSTELSLEIQGDSVIWTEDRALPPALGENGICATCHRHALTVKGHLSNSSITAVMGGKKGVSIFGEVGYSRKFSKLVAVFSYNDNNAGITKVAAHCFSPAFQSLGLVCGETCCNPRFGSCEECLTEIPDVFEVRELFI